MKIHPLITTAAELEKLCATFAESDFIAVDTEFMRENTYWPELDLIQVANTHEAAAIDPLAPGMNLDPLLDLLTDNDKVLKVFHAGGQDVEIIYNLTGRTPQPIFDTQIAMMALSQAEQIGYGPLVETWLGVTIDKGARFTDWSRRPLSERQIQYAISDVTYLTEIFPRMLDKLRDTGRGVWLNQEMEKIADPAHYRIDPDQAWLRLKAPVRNAAVLGRLRALAAWREQEAQGKNIPRGRIARDETLADLAAHPPAVQEDLARVRGLSASWKNNDIGRRLIQVLKDAQPLSKEDMPAKGHRRPPLGKEGALVVDLLKLLLKIRAREIDVAPRLLARSSELESLAAGAHAGLPMLEGWRFEQFGRDALHLVEGHLAFGVVNGRLSMKRLEDTGDTDAQQSAYAAE